MCRYKGCKARRGLTDGYCRVHQSQVHTPTSPSSKNDGIKYEALSKKLDQMATMIAQLQEENVTLTNIVSEQSDKVEFLTKENADLKQKVNLNFLANDSINQHGRKENIRIHNEPEAENERMTARLPVNR